MEKQKLQVAKRFATKAHEGQVRKVTEEPYITHPIAVANLLSAAGFSEEVVIAGLLHDTVEDTEVTFEEIQAKFGKKVVELVKGNTEDKRLSWQERKQHTIDSVRIASLELKGLVVADKLDNVQSLLAHYSDFGEHMWDNFKGSKDQQKWYYESVANSAFYGLKKEEIPDLFYQLKAAISRLLET